MLVRADASIVGTVGGGVLEANTVKTALKTIAAGKAAVAEFVLEENGASAIGAACGGRAKVLIDYIDAGDSADTLFLKSCKRRPAPASGPISRR
jgi:xanthine dehydrogenase accessory factor